MTALDGFPKLVALRDSVPESDRPALLKVLAGPYPTAEAVAIHLLHRGHEISASTIRTYRRRLRLTGAPTA